MLNAAFLDLPYLFLVIHTATLVSLFKIRLLQLSNPYLPNSHDTNTLLFWKGGTGLVWLLEPNEDTYFKQKSFTVLLSAVLSILGKDQFMHRYTPLRLGNLSSETIGHWADPVTPLGPKAERHLSGGNEAGKYWSFTYQPNMSCCSREWTTTFWS